MLGPAPDGAEASKTYRAAVKAEPKALDPYESLSAKLGRAAEAEDFVKAADDVLDNGPIVLLGYGLVFDSGPLRDRVLPELNRSLAEFRPSRCRRAPATWRSRSTARCATSSARSTRWPTGPTAGSSYEFSYDTQYNAARQAVQDYATEVDGDVAEALDRIRGERPILAGSRAIGTWSMPASSKCSPVR